MIHKYKYKSYEEFLSIRRTLSCKGQKDQYRIGGSDLSTIYSNGERIGLNEYTAPTVFYRSATDFINKQVDTTLEMARGTLHESFIYNNYWKHLDPEHPTPESWLENFTGQKLTYRTAKKSNAIYVNDKYPWIAVSPDYEFGKSVYNKKGVIELKCPSSRAVEKYEAGTPTSYVIQLYTQMLVLDLPYGELFQLLDATIPQLFVFERNNGIEQNIIDSSHCFYKKVLAGKKIVYSNMTDVEKEQALSELGPKDDGNPLFTDYLKERHKPENALATVPGNSEQLGLVIEYVRLKQSIKEQSKELLMLENKIRELFTDTTIGKLQWEGIGYVSWVSKFTVSKSILKSLNIESE